MRSRHCPHPQLLGRFLQSVLAARRALAVPVDGNVVLATEGADARLRPSVLPAGGLAESIEKGRNRLVRQLAR